MINLYKRFSPEGPFYYVSSHSQVEDAEAQIITLGGSADDYEIIQEESVQAEKIKPEDVPTSQQIVEKKIAKAIEFGQGLIAAMAVENVLLGITQAGKTNAVRKASSEVINALQTGSLYDAIAAIRAIPSESKDAVFLNDERLLVVVNKIETYLELPHSESL